MRIRGQPGVRLDLHADQQSLRRMFAEQTALAIHKCQNFLDTHAQAIYPAVALRLHRHAGSGGEGRCQPARRRSGRLSSRQILDAHDARDPGPNRKQPARQPRQHSRQPKYWAAVCIVPGIVLTTPCGCAGGRAWCDGPRNPQRHERQRPRSQARHRGSGERGVHALRQGVPAILQAVEPRALPGPPRDAVAVQDHPRLRRPARRARRRCARSMRTSRRSIKGRSTRGQASGCRRMRPVGLRVREPNQPLREDGRKPRGSTRRFTAKDRSGFLQALDEVVGRGTEEGPTDHMRLILLSSRRPGRKRRKTSLMGS